MVDFKKLLAEQKAKEIARKNYESIFGTRTENDLIDNSLLDMAKVEKSPEYIKGDDIKGKSGIKFKILDEFKIGGDYDRLQGTVQVIDGENKYKAFWSPSKTVGNQLIDAFGDDTVDWLSKEVEVRHAEKNGKSMIVLAQETL